MVQNFWDKTWAEFEPVQINPITFRESAGQSNKIFLDIIGEVSGKNVLDIGCGNGLLSVYLAKMGGRVTAIDNSPLAIRNTRALARMNKVGSLIESYRLDAFELNNLGKSFDVVVGQFILHHIEPFDTFSEILFNITRKGGRGIFFENNSRNPILILLRTYLAGRFGIPKYGDTEEFPFEPREIEILNEKFDSVHLHYPVFMFFSLMGPYLFERNKRVWNIFYQMDRWIHRHFPIFNKYSYHQIIEVQKYY